MSVQVDVPSYRWTAAAQFLGREDELSKLEKWWDDRDAEPLNLFGRRRVGKSWLLRRFAHGKPAIFIVADRTTSTQQLDHISEQLTPFLGVKPQIGDVGHLFQLLYGLAVQEQTLVVVDEFPYLLGTSNAEIRGALSSVQAVMEQNRDDSRVRLAFCGSAVAQMEAMQSEKSPLHGRLRRFLLSPMSFRESRLFMQDPDPRQQLVRYSITGGMPRYLTMLGKGNLTDVLADTVVDRQSPLFNEPPTLLQTEVREPATYFAILSALAQHPQDIGGIGKKVGMDSRKLSPYLQTLETLRLASRQEPVGSRPGSRQGHWRSDDCFMRFWFRFVQPFQIDLEAGSDPRSHVRQHIIGHLPEHTALVFEDVFRRWVRQEYPDSSSVGSWWGNSANEFRANKSRSSEEVDVVGLKGRTVGVVGEAKWTTKPMSLSVLTDIRNYKSPALGQTGLKVDHETQIVLASRNGFASDLVTFSASDPSIRLVDAEHILLGLR